MSYRILGPNYSVPASNIPSLSGDVTGTIDSNKVVSINGYSVSSNTPLDGYTLVWNSTLSQWVPNNAGTATTTLTPVTLIPVPNGDRYRAFFVWHFSSTDSVIQSDGDMQTCLNTCAQYGYNLLFLGVEPFLSPAYYSAANELAIRKFVHYCHLSGIEVHACMGQSGTYGDGYARSPYDPVTGGVTFNVTNNSNSVIASGTTHNLVAGNVIYFLSQPFTYYTVLSASGTAIVLTSNYTGTSNSATHVSLGNGFGTSQDWYLQNIVTPVQNYNLKAAVNPNYPDSAFDGLLIDAEYYNSGISYYPSSEAIGMLDALVATKRLLPNIKIGFTPNYLLTLTNNAYNIVYDGYQGLEGYHYLNNCDYVVVQDYSNSSSTQISRFNSWFNYASQNGIGLNVGVMLTSDVNYPDAGKSYNTNTSGDIVNFETNMKTISNTYTAAGGASTNCAYWGVAVEDYYQYLTMKP